MKCFEYLSSQCGAVECSILFAYFFLREYGINTKPEKAVKIYATTDLQDVDN